MRLILPAIAISISSHAAADDRAHPLVVASREAIRACAVIEADSIESCGNFVLRSPEATVARRAVRRAYEARSKFMDRCTESLASCQRRADLLILMGMYDASAESTTSSRPAPTE
jgi:hypothetical protein